MASWVSFDIGCTWQRLGVLGIASGDAVGHPGGVLTSIPKNGWATSAYVKHREAKTLQNRSLPHTRKHEPAV